MSKDAEEPTPAPLTLMGPTPPDPEPIAIHADEPEFTDQDLIERAEAGVGDAIDALGQGEKWLAELAAAGKLETGVGIQPSTHASIAIAANGVLLARYAARRNDLARNLMHLLGDQAGVQRGIRSGLDHLVASLDRTAAVLERMEQRLIADSEPEVPIAQPGETRVAE